MTWTLSLPTHYVLRPKSALLEWLCEHLPGSELEEPRLWSQDEVVPETPSQSEHRETWEMRMKLTILAELQCEADKEVEGGPRPTREPAQDPARIPATREDAEGWGAEKEARLRRALRTLLSPAPPTLEHFDRWWTLERVGVVSHAETTLNLTPFASLQKVRGPRFREGRNDPCDAVSRWWSEVQTERVRNTRLLRYAVAWLLEHFAGLTPLRVCFLRVRPFLLEPLGEAPLEVPGWTVSTTRHRFQGGLYLSLWEWDWFVGWRFRYVVRSESGKAVHSGTVSLDFEGSEEEPHIGSAELIEHHPRRLAGLAGTRPMVTPWVPRGG
ncbi:hypothetical protein LZ198_12970 [Myxococcus sp. K15C18031901]|uniref:hypothetical protein n=1 Tax=Myxococcus dinghuensis TaxID=2906761 RepID=UPI0020A70D08|nr:hypothetical protein [Myxococcus dinghuensis]MCP3099779.1 hypothetical protein [Myxococcus dinghuensis]